MSTVPHTEHRWDIILLGLIAAGVIGYMTFATSKGQPVDAATCFVVLTLIVGAIKERWLSRSVDHMGQRLAEAPAPAPEVPRRVEVVNPPDHPVPVKEE